MSEPLYVDAAEKRTMNDALAEIERLRTAIRRLAEQDATLSVQGGNVTVTMDATLTDQERSAVEWCVEMAVLHATECEDEIAALRGLLERTQPTHAKPDEGSVRPECAISPPWMARPFYVDPASGWEYGFPKLYDPATDGDMTTWLVANGYPQHLADQHLPCRFTAAISE